MKTLLELASPVRTSITPDETVQRAVEIMFDRGTGAIPVIKNNKLVGIFSERDLLRRVVAKKMVPEKTKVSEVMTSNVTTVVDSSRVDDAFHLMHKGQFRNLPIVDKGGKILAMLSVLDLLKYRIDELNEETKTLAAYVAADGAGG